MSLDGKREKRRSKLLSLSLFLTVAVRQPGHELLVGEELAVVGGHEVVRAGAGRGGGGGRGGLGGGRGRVCLSEVDGKKKGDE